MKNEKIPRKISERLTADGSHIEDDVLLADGFDDAFIGVTIGIHPQEQCAVYSRNKCIEILTSDMSYEDAVEYFEFNVSCAYVGDRTPIFIEKM